jgi:transcriptional antiterminator NusG
VVEALPRFDVDADRTWYIVRTRPRWASRMAAWLGKAREHDGPGIPSFQPRDEIELVRPDGRRQVVRAPILRRLLFVGLYDPDDMRAVQSHIGYDRMMSRDGRFLTIASDELQRFADELNGHGEGAQKAAQPKFKQGQSISVSDGPLASHAGTIEAVDRRRAVYRVLVTIFGRETPVELDEGQLEAAE